MKKDTSIKLFNQKQVRTHWNKERKNGIFLL